MKSMIPSLLLAAALASLAFPDRALAGSPITVLANTETPLTLTGFIALVGADLDADVAAAPLACEAQERPTGRQACRVARRYGRYLIDVAPPLTSKVRLRRLTVHIRQGCVEAATFETSPDNFHRVVSLLKGQFGEPDIRRSDPAPTSKVARPRATMSWSAPNLQVSLTNPTPAATMQVRVSLRGPQVAQAPSS